MSGRVRWWRDGQLVTGYRKTDRRQGLVTVQDRLARLAHRGASSEPHLPVRMAFTLPRTLAGFLGSGDHGLGVSVLRGFVRIAGLSADQCCAKAATFFRDVARERPCFTVTAVLIRLETGVEAASVRYYSRHLTVVGGILIVSGGMVPPKVFEAA